jgi:hypothetical protein
MFMQTAQLYDAVSIPGNATFLSFSQIPDRPWDPILYPMDTASSYLGGGGGGGGREAGCSLPFPPHTFMAQC